MSLRNMRKLRAAAAGLAAVLLLSGCRAAEQPASGAQVASSTGSGTAGEAAAGADRPAYAQLDDGELRYNGAAGIVFCGAQPCFRVGGHEQVYLLTDAVTGETEYFLSGAPQGSDAYVYTVRDKTGAPVYELGERRGYQLCEGWLLVQDDQRWNGPPSVHCALVQLSTGREIALPDGASDLYSPQEGLLCVSIWQWDEESELSRRKVQLYDGQGALLQEIPDVTSYGGAQSLLPDGWLRLERQGSGQVDTILYDTATGRVVENCVGLCGEGLACVQQEEGYALIRVEDGAVLQRADLPILCQLGDQLVLEGFDVNDGLETDGRYFRLEAADGSRQAVDFIQDAETGLCAMRTAQTVRLYRDGELLLEEPYQLYVAAPGEFVSYTLQIYPQSQRLMLNRSIYGNGIDQEQYIMLYSADGTVWDEPLTAYAYVDYPDGLDYGYGLRETASGGYLYDILALDGTVLLADASNVTACEPEFFACRRGFECGWMDLEGGWLWKESVWASAVGDDAESYWW